MRWPPVGRALLFALGGLLMGWPTSAPAAPPPPPSPELMQQLQEQVRRFEEAARDLRRDVRRVVQLKYDEKREQVIRTYEGRMKGLEEEEEKRRLDAIARFEEFLRKYPDNPVYSPDAMFRLAELYFERSNDIYLAAVEHFENEMADFENGRRKDRPEEPQKDYSRAIELFQSLLTDFPRYRYNDGAYYLLGYCLTETGKDEQGRAIFAELVQKHPNSTFSPEAWVRIGEYHFDFNELQPAAEAYLQVLRYPASVYFDKALYKLAWTYYRMDQFDQAINRFKELVAYYDEHKTGTGSSGADLRSEAIQYLAISLAEEDWDGDGQSDPEPPVQRAFRYLTGAKAYEVEVLRRLGDIFFDNTRYQDAVALYRHLIKRFPLDPSNPEVQSKIITALERQQKRDEAMAEREILSRSFGQESEWHQANQGDTKAQRLAEQLSQDALMAAAVYNHDKAQGLKDRAKVMGDAAAAEESKRFYEIAARNYEEYLRRYPYSKNAYELSFFYADCLYFSHHFPEAAAQYARVRDADPEGKYREEAATATTLALEQYLEGLIKQGRLAYRASPSYDPAKDPNRPAVAPSGQAGATPPAPEEIPAPLQELVAARDAYVKAGLRSKQDPLLRGRMAFKAAEVFYRYQHYDEARTRFEQVIKEHPKEEVASLAASYIIESYRLTRNWEKMAEWGDKVAALDLGTPQERDTLKKEVTTLKVGALFKKAQGLAAEKKYEEAAQEYVRLVNENPGNEFADRALNNAALAYETIGKYESAMKLYERVYREYPNREFAEHALYRTAVNSERFFNWDKAIDSYTLLVDKFPRSEKRADSLYIAAQLLENTQRYQDAITAYQRYISEYPDRQDIPATIYMIALIYEKMGDHVQMFRVFNQYIKSYGNDPAHNSEVMTALGKMADRLLEQNRWNEAAPMLRRIIREFEERRLTPGSPDAVHPAKAQFLLTEQEFKTYEAIRIQGSVVQQGETIKRMKTLSRTLSERYALVFDYKNLDWTLAAYFRLASLFQKFAEKLYAAPVPGAIANDPDAAEEYRAQLEEVAVPIEDEAVRRFEKAVAEARANKIVNDWTRKALGMLNKYKPAEYPLLREERRELLEEPESGLPTLRQLPLPNTPAPAEATPVGPGGNP